MKFILTLASIGFLVFFVFLGWCVIVNIVMVFVIAVVSIFKWVREKIFHHGR